MESVLGLVDVKWGLLASRFATIEPNGRINYAKFLDRYRIEMRPEDSAWQEEVLETICERLYECASNLEQAYKASIAVLTMQWLRISLLETHMTGV